MMQDEVVSTGPPDAMAECLMNHVIKACDAEA